MNRFEGICFKGTFRSYQQRVLDNAKRYLEDGKVHIVAAAGSGKSVLGLELIRRIGEPCLILCLSPAICDRWGRQLQELFLEDGRQPDKLFSTNLYEPKLINAMTYEALYRAMEHIPGVAGGEVNYANLDLMRILKKHGIKTICLDEAHHLKPEWQKSLERVLGRLGKQAVRISLTSIPPYDAQEEEWNKILSMCGEVDEEIFLPELMVQGDICPHQDYIYFNYPTPEEEKAFQEHREQVKLALAEVGKLECIQKTADYLIQLNPRRDYVQKMLKQFPHEIEALLVLLRYYGKLLNLNMSWKKKLLGDKSLPKPDDIYFQRALKFLLAEGTRFCAAEYIGELQRLLKKHQLYKNQKVTFEAPEKIREKVITSLGKLQSIGEIALHEYRCLGADLRMLILTDYNRGTRENLQKIGTDEPYTDISVVSIFETLRRMDDTLNVGVLSGSLIILPRELVSAGTMVSVEPLEGTRYAKVEMYGSRQESLDLVNQLFREGKIQVLVAAKALLEEGWKEPYLNALIMACFIDTLHFSNQVRGQVIGTNPEAPDKTVNIWHLVTLEPEPAEERSPLERLAEVPKEEVSRLISRDYELIKQRFALFMGPNYTTGEIQSGIGRLTLIHPPFGKEDVSQINRDMLQLASDRNKMCKLWKKQLATHSIAVVKETVLPQVKCNTFSGYLRKSIRKTAFIAGGLFLLLLVLIAIPVIGYYLGMFAFSMLCTLFVGFIAVIPFQGIYSKKFNLPIVQKICRRMLIRGSGAGSVDILGGILQKTLEDCKLIAPGTTLLVDKGSLKDKRIRVQLRDASMHDQNVFNSALREMLSPITNPRFLLVPKNAKPEDKALYSLAGPSIIGDNSEYVRILKKHLVKSLCFWDIAYTDNPEGRTLLESCRKTDTLKQREMQPAQLTMADTNYVVVKEAKRLLLEDKGKKNI